MKHIQELSGNDLKEGLVRVSRDNLHFFVDEKTPSRELQLKVLLPDGKYYKSCIQLHSKTGAPRFLRDIRVPLRDFYTNVGAEIGDLLTIEKGVGDVFVVNFVKGKIANKQSSVVLLDDENNDWTTSAKQKMVGVPISAELTEPNAPPSDFGDPTESSAQGYESDPLIRRAVEQHAVKLAIEHYFDGGYQVKELGKPFDLLCEKQGEVIHVEVKGSRSQLAAVIVTTNEIKDARLPTWRSDLFIVEGIVIAYDDQKTLQTHGGSSRVLRNWTPIDSDLKPTQFRYALPTIGDWIEIGTDK